MSDGRLKVMKTTDTQYWYITNRAPRSNSRRTASFDMPSVPMIFTLDPLNPGESRPPPSNLPCHLTADGRMDLTYSVGLRSATRRDRPKTPGSRRRSDQVR